METKSLKSAVKEFNKVVILKDPVNVKSENLGRDMYEALEYIEPEDEFTEETKAIFDELREMYAKPKKEKKSKKEKTVEVGQTVEMEPDTSEIKKVKEMKKEKETGEKQKPEVRIIKTILDRKVDKPTLEALIKDEDVFDKKTKKALGKVTNFMSLKKQMLDVFDPELVKSLRAELPAINHTPKAKPESKPAPENKIVNSIKSSIKVKQLKGIAKENTGMFNWKELKKLEDFEEIQEAMLKMVEPKAKVKFVPEIKKVANPLIAEIEAFTKAKKLVKWAKEMDEFADVKKMKKLGLSELQEALIAAIPAEIEVTKGKGKFKPRSENKAAERKAFILPLLKEGKYTRPELKAMLDEKFGIDTPQSHPHNNMLSEIKNERYYQKYGLGALVEESKKGKYRFVK